MRKKYPSVVRALFVLALIVSLTGVLAVAPAVADTDHCDGLVTLTPGDEGTVGSVLSIAVNGDIEGLAVVVTFDTVTLTTYPASAVTDEDGDVMVQVTIPAASAGAHELIVYVGAEPCVIEYTINPAIKIEPIKGKVGSTATVTGSGFTAGIDITSIKIDPDGASKTMATQIAIDSVGGFTADVTIPGLTAQADPFTVRATDGNGKFADTGFTVQPTLALTPSGGKSGDEVTISGKYWQQNTTITFMFGGQLWDDAEVVADADGEIKDPVTGGAWEVATPVGAGVGEPGVKLVVGMQGADIISATAFSVASRDLTVTPAGGPKGIKVLITGEEMTSDGTILEDMLMIGEHGGWNADDIEIDTSGNIEATTLTIPDDVEVGVNVIVAVDDGGLVASGIFMVSEPTLAVTPDQGARSSTAQVTGTQWVPNSDVTLEFNGDEYTAYTDANGNFAYALVIPPEAISGLIQAWDDDGNVAEGVQFTIPGRNIKVTPGTGSSGDALEIAGSGFLGYSGIEVTLTSAAGDYILPVTPLTSSMGDFTLQTTVPALAPGNLQIKAGDNEGTATAFYILAAAPETVKTAMASIMDQLEIVWGYIDAEWLFFDPNDEVGSDLPGLVKGNGYWVLVTEDCVLTYGGYSYTLTMAWNNIGWLGK